MSIELIELGDISISVIRKQIKNLHLSVHPPQGRTTISAPLRMDFETIRLFSISKLAWIRKQQIKLRNQKRETVREYISGESHFYFGKRYLLKLIEDNSPPKIVLKHDTLEMHVPKAFSMARRQKVLNNWYRQQLRVLLLPYISKWEIRMAVKVFELRIRIMKTRWGTCNRKVNRVWLNTELAKKPIECIEYVLVHEMVHLLEKGHSRKFHAYMDAFLPKWKYVREELNRSALGHVEWSY